jgi:hypothetical protein
MMQCNKEHFILAIYESWLYNLQCNFAAMSTLCLVCLSVPRGIMPNTSKFD